MAFLHKIIDEYWKLYSSTENERRLSMWERPEEGIRWENQWHGIPAYKAESGNQMPVTAECLDKIWEKLLGLDMRRFFTEPEYYLEYYLRMRIKKFLELSDDTPLTVDIPLVFGVTHEAGLLGQKIFLDLGEEPTFSRESIVDDNTEFPETFDFTHNDYLSMVIPFYNRMKEAAGEGFRVIFPQWYRGPQGAALYIRGFQEFSLDLYENESFSHRLLRYVTNAAKAYALWRQDFTQEPIAKGDLFNDDIPLMSPEMYEKYFYPYEKELSDFYGGIYYWHSCGDITPHVSKIDLLPEIDLIDFGVSMEDKSAGMQSLKKDQPVELRIKAQNHIQECSEEEAMNYIRKILDACRKYSVQRYVIRSSGMSIVHGAETDLKMLGRWVELVRRAQENIDR